MRTYMPILKWKQGELRALRELVASDRATTIPLIELVDDPVDEDVGDDPAAPVGPYQDLVKDLFKAWGSEPCFVDLGATVTSAAAGGVHAVDRFFGLAAAGGAKAIAVAAIGADAAHVKAVATVAKRDGRGACIRLPPADLASGSLTSDLQKLLSGIGLSEASVDLLVDWEAIDEGAAAQTFLTVNAIVPRIPNLAKWRSVTFGAGAFPNTLQSIGVGRGLIHRAEWEAYRMLIANPPGGRVLSFADYAIAYPVYDPVPYPGSAALRYTIDDDWLIYRGRSLRGPRFGGYAQFFGLCQQLVKDKEYRGKTFSWGDNEIDMCAQQKGGPGNLPRWRSVGTNHHVALVTRQLASYRVPSSGAAPPHIGP